MTLFNSPETLKGLAVFIFLPFMQDLGRYE